MHHHDPHAEKWYRRQFSVPQWLLLILLPVVWFAIVLPLRGSLLIAAALLPAFVFWMAAAVSRGAFRRADEPSVGLSADSALPPGRAESATWTPMPAVGVARRFGVGKLMLMIALFAVLFKLLQWLRAPSILFVDATLFFLGVGAAQVILFRGKQPRQASVVAGAVLGPVIGIGSALCGRWVLDSDASEFDEVGGLLCTAVAMTLCGAPLGYMAGCLVASLFLIKEQGAEIVEAKADPLAPDAAVERGGRRSIRQQREEGKS